MSFFHKSLSECAESFSKKVVDLEEHAKDGMHHGSEVLTKKLEDLLHHVEKDLEHAKEHVQEPMHSELVALKADIEKAIADSKAGLKVDMQNILAKLKHIGDYHKKEDTK